MRLTKHPGYGQELPQVRNDSGINFGPISSVYFRNLLQSNNQLRNSNHIISNCTPTIGSNITNIFTNEQSKQKAINYVKKYRERNLNSLVNDKGKTQIKTSYINESPSPIRKNDQKIEASVGYQNNRRGPQLKQTKFNQDEMEILLEKDSNLRSNRKEYGSANLGSDENFNANPSFYVNNVNYYDDIHDEKEITTRRNPLEKSINLAGTGYSSHRNNGQSTMYIRGQRNFSSNKEIGQYIQIKTRDTFKIEHFDMEINFIKEKANANTFKRLKKEIESFSLMAKPSLLKVDDNDDITTSNKNKKLKSKKIKDKDEDDYGDLTGYVVLHFRKGKKVKCYTIDSDSSDLDDINVKFKEDEININNNYLQFINLSKKISNDKTKNNETSIEKGETTDDSRKEKEKIEVQNVNTIAIKSEKKKDDEEVIHKKDLDELVIENDSIEIKSKKKKEINTISKSENVQYDPLYKSKNELLKLNEIVKGDILSIMNDITNEKPQKEKRESIRQSINKKKTIENEIEEADSFIIEKINKTPNLIEVKESFDIKAEHKAKINNVIHIPSIEILSSKKDTFNSNKKIDKNQIFQIIPIKKQKTFDYISIGTPVEINLISKADNTIEIIDEIKDDIPNEIKQTDIIQTLTNPLDNQKQQFPNISYDTPSDMSNQINQSIRNEDDIIETPFNENVEKKIATFEGILDLPQDIRSSNKYISKPIIELPIEHLNKDKFKKYLTTIIEIEDIPEVYQILDSKPTPKIKKKKPQFSNFNENFCKSQLIEESKKEMLNNAKLKAVSLRNKLRKGK